VISTVGRPPLGDTGTFGPWTSELSGADPPPLEHSWRSAVEDFLLAVRARGGRVKTVQTYRESLASLARYLDAQEGGPAVWAVSLPMLRRWLIHLDELGQAPATRHLRCTAVRRFFRHALEARLIAHDPSVHLRPPKVPAAVTPVLQGAELALLFQGPAQGRHRARDRALLGLLLDTGLRRGELAGLRLTDLELEQARLWVVGKGGGRRLLPLSEVAAGLLTEYLGVRHRYPGAGTDALWLGERGTLSGTGIYRTLARVYTRVGLSPRSRVHVFRHTFAHRWKLAGGSDEDLMAIGGWSRPEAQERALAAHRRLSPLAGLLEREVVA
jgi:site-specific recombinase XerD